MTPETTPWSVRPIVSQNGTRTGVQILNNLGDVAAQVIGGSDDVLAMAITLVSVVNAKAWNLDIRPEGMFDMQALWLAEYQSAKAAWDPVRLTPSTEAAS